MTAEIIAIGSELLTPFRQDTNSLYLTDQLERLGISVTQKTIVGDHRERLKQAFADALKRADLVIGMGGLGPTEDDRTREAVAELLERKLERNQDVVAMMEERFRSRGKKMPAVNLRQAQVPQRRDCGSTRKIKRLSCSCRARRRSCDRCSRRAVCPGCASAPPNRPSPPKSSRSSG
jgi:molybdenum cofactor synthesis domain-containing protein